MKPPFLSMLCGGALAIMTATGFGHWCMVRGIVAAHPVTPAAAPARMVVAPPPVMAAAPVAPAPPLQTPAPARKAAPSDPQREFYASLLKEVRSIKNENATLRDQLAQTNSELYSLRFQVDTHSAQFRPLHVDDAEDHGTLGGDLTSPPVIDNDPSVLPPLPEIVGLPELQPDTPAPR